ncbi:phosphoglycerate mutase-like protein 4 isoform X1 [Senna tora]|uniref:Phosphoglycerate mutase-like protein 4 isoform X1 n=1 Tax=Senna tora TaxID=362788 RepID=A0A834SUL2_9FABA|nr:phosphoglycerate mutase-like protein 4 isoform X1 [Senna tora]
MANKDDVASGGGGQRIKNPTINAKQQQLKVFLGEIGDWIDSQEKRIASSQISQPKSRRHNRQEFVDVFPEQIPPGLPPIGGIKYQIVFFRRATIPNNITACMALNDLDAAVQCFQKALELVPNNGSVYGDQIPVKELAERVASYVHLCYDKDGPQLYLVEPSGVSCEIEKLKLSDMTCQQGVIEVVKISDHPEYAEIVVVRHGETAWNADGRIQGHLDVELNEVGRQQAAAVADRLSSEPKVSVIYSSDLQRAYDTALAIATRCGGLEVVKDPELRERHLGDLQGISYREAAKTHPKAHKALLSGNRDQEIPGGGESLAQLYKRCTSALQRIGTKHKGERVVVVTHGGVIRSLYKRACPNKSAGKVLNTSVNVFHLYNENKWTVKTWGDVSHLKETEILQTGFGGDKNSDYAKDHYAPAI